MIAPLYTLVLLEPVEPIGAEEKGKYIIPAEKGDPIVKTGSVLGVGSKVEDLASGDRVLYRAWTTIEVEKDKLYLIESRDILAKETL